MAGASSSVLFEEGLGLSCVSASYAGFGINDFDDDLASQLASV
jgi:hypothetical protein